MAREREEQTWEERRHELIGANNVAGSVAEDEEEAEEQSAITFASLSPRDSPMIERLDPSEVDYLRAVLADMAQAQAEYGGLRKHLSKKYSLTDADGIDADGVIHRAAKPE